jgi:hypothetical protein
MNWFITTGFPKPNRSGDAFWEICPIFGRFAQTAVVTGVKVREGV